MTRRRRKPKTGAVAPPKEVNVDKQQITDKIAELEQALQQRANNLVATDPTCQRLMGQMEGLRLLNSPNGQPAAVEEESPELEVVT